MCGIVGYVGSADSVKARRQRALDVVMGGLRRLEYRGYDSSGIAIQSEGRIHVRKKTGKISNLAAAVAAEPLPDGKVAIGHTRWATHGAPTDANAHPHLADQGRLAVIHNGIIENAAPLRHALSGSGHDFASETDTEVAAALLAQAYRAVVTDCAAPAAAEDALAEAMRRACLELEGSFTLLAVHADHPGLVVAARRNSPLVVGMGDGENYLGSDVAAFGEFTRRAVELGQDQVVAVTADNIAVTDFNGAPVEVAEVAVDWDPATASKGGHSSFMAKEMLEQPEAVRRTIQGRIGVDGSVRLDGLGIDDSTFAGINKVVVVACGTASYGGQIAKYAIERWCRIPVEVDLAHEFRYRTPMLDSRTLVVAISQSGETMDTLMAVRYAREQGAVVLSICNTQGSTIARESNGVLHTLAGPEIAVASTKAFLAQVTANILLGLYLAQLRGSALKEETFAVARELRMVPDLVQRTLAGAPRVKALAADMREATSVLFVGRHVGFPVALEGALKLKELAYIHAEGLAAGELKHGAIALIDHGQPVIVIVPSLRHSSLLHSKVMSTIQEIKARGGRVIAVAEEGDGVVAEWADEVITVPESSPLLAPLLTTVPLQLFAAGLAAEKGLDVDQPRNLAKSVTVE
ncbi:glutamine--fructose-6-phosphate transaminase (isomerizing) [Paenarthrobacter ureafaciens]|uniref:glutamine--fructose-6-phosphate transaminase (isomerizing) n=1 Tax=Paenarthrobacter ureafaciens TaxID=37931 RepID=UPI002DBA6AB2|nr:glutamine--fructose-6-phosphate transaminase (isomerizing) [Paenarthrobacter ureafaciens]MEC3851880.1 glutamine--fructose-6-phosphate transaminase (isomerizing) [Paenarthrobacter ureafaciens]